MKINIYPYEREITYTAQEDDVLVSLNCFETVYGSYEGQIFHHQQVEKGGCKCEFTGKMCQPVEIGNVKFLKRPVSDDVIGILQNALIEAKGE